MRKGVAIPVALKHPDGMTEGTAIFVTRFQIEVESEYDPMIGAGVELRMELPGAHRVYVVMRVVDTRPGRWAITTVMTGQITKMSDTDAREYAAWLTSLPVPSLPQRARSVPPGWQPPVPAEVAIIAVLRDHALVTVSWPSLLAFRRSWDTELSHHGLTLPVEGPLPPIGQPLTSVLHLPNGTTLCALSSVVLHTGNRIAIHLLLHPGDEAHLRALAQTAG